MRILAITAQPNPQSLPHPATEEFTRRPADSKREPLVVDLHANGIKPVFQVRGFAQDGPAPVRSLHLVAARAGQLR